MNKPIPIGIPESFRKKLAKKTPDLQAAIYECIERLGENPRHPGLQAHIVKGAGKGTKIWEAYVDAGNRVTFQHDADGILLRNHCNHDILNRHP